MANDEVLVSVDIEASGPSPGTGSMIALGACLVDDPARSIYLELKPLPGMPWSAAAERVHQLDRRRLEAEGVEPAQAMRRLSDWLIDVADGRRPVLVGWNAAFDWMFVADYYNRFVGSNPFGIAPLDMKAYVMGHLHLRRWSETRRDALVERYAEASPLSHHALEDARHQAALFRRLLEEDDGPR
ncbi:MAG: 3'-5' exonuclease [Chloroflexota bacterium]|nr:3'-5' exonuclease [Chloroflexota bacterium]